jgi:hypothetical protein
MPVVTNVSKSLMHCELVWPKDLVSPEVSDRFSHAVLGTD